jgi:hypothetical protein
MAVALALMTAGRAGKWVSRGKEEFWAKPQNSRLSQIFKSPFNAGIRRGRKFNAITHFPEITSSCLDANTFFDFFEAG